MKPANSIIIFFAAMVISGCAGLATEDGQDKPEIVEVFACSDYCPGPDEKYMKRVYDGVTDEGECLKLGGRPYTYIGWSEYTVCVAE